MENQVEEWTTAYLGGKPRGLGKGDAYTFPYPLSKSL